MKQKNYYKENKENLKHGIVRFHLNIDVRKEKKDSWLNAIKPKTKIPFLWSKISTAASAHLMGSLLDNWVE